MKYIGIILLFIPFIAMASIINEEVLVERIKLDNKKKIYRVSLYGKAGVYYSSDKNLDCLKLSIQKNQKVFISYNTKGLMLIKCKSVAPKIK